MYKNVTNARKEKKLKFLSYFYNDFKKKRNKKKICIIESIITMLVFSPSEKKINRERKI